MFNSCREAPYHASPYTHGAGTVWALLFKESVSAFVPKLTLFGTEREWEEKVPFLVHVEGPNWMASSGLAWESVPARLRDLMARGYFCVRGRNNGIARSLMLG